MLQFSDTSTKNGIIQRLEFETGLGDASISGNATLLAQFTALINAGYSNVVRIILEADGRNSYDDTNATNSPTCRANIVSGQGDYRIFPVLPASDQDFLKIERVEAVDNFGNFIKLNPRNIGLVNGSILDERETGGVPEYYDIAGPSIFLDPIPNYSATLGLIIWFQRAPINFATTDTTKRPGFMSTFHEYLVLYPLYNWLRRTNASDSEKVKRDMIDMENAIKNAYGKIDKSEPSRILRARKSFK